MEMLSLIRLNGLSPSFPLEIAVLSLFSTQQAFNMCLFEKWNKYLLEAIFYKENKSCLTMPSGWNFA